MRKIICLFVSLFFAGCGEEIETLECEEDYQCRQDEICNDIGECKRTPDCVK